MLVIQLRHSAPTPDAEVVSCRSLSLPAVLFLNLWLIIAIMVECVKGKRKKKRTGKNKGKNGKEKGRQGKGKEKGRQERETGRKREDRKRANHRRRAVVLWYGGVSGE